MSISGTWKHPATIERNNFKYKSLSCWSFNIAVGCSHACRFCYVPDVSTRKLGPSLAPFGVKDPDAEWGDYVFLRRWDEKAFLSSLRSAEQTPESELNRDGNRCVMFCTTTDPYMVIRNDDSEQQKNINHQRSEIVRRALELIRDKSTLNVRILTRSSLARLDFELMASFGPRLLFGMSLPTLNDQLSKIYEPKAPGPSARLRCMQDAKEVGLNVYVAMAPTYPECDRYDLKNTLREIAALDPLTVFHEPINIRAENVKRIRQHAHRIGVIPKLEVFDTTNTWAQYAFEQLSLVSDLAPECGISRDQLHLWPDASLKKYVSTEWLKYWWEKISAMPAAEVEAK